MTGHRFFLSPEIFNRPEVFFPANLSKQIVKVLRLNAGQSVTVLDDLGHFRIVTLNEIDPHQVTGTGGEIQPAGCEPVVQLVLCPAITQREKFELILQKGSELGVSEFHPLLTSRTLSQDKHGWDEKLSRWQKILQEAAEQCGRGLIPKVFLPSPMEKVIEQLAEIPGMILHEKCQNSGMRAGMESMKNKAALFIGPEGGFTENEVGLAIGKGLLPVSLGDRVLRMETAAIAACSIFMAYAGELGDSPFSD